MMNLQTITKFLISIFIALNLGLNIAYAQPLDKIIAIINDDIVTQTELNQKRNLVLSRIKPDAQLPPQHILNKQILDKIIIEKLQLQLAATQDISLESMQVNNTIKSFIANENITAEEFFRKLAGKGVPKDIFRNYIKNELIIAELQRREIGYDTVITNSEVESFVNSPIGQDLSGTKYLLGHILLSFPEIANPEKIKTLETKAYKLVNKLKSGEDFSKTAMAQSAGINALEGGNLGWRTAGEIPTMFVKYITAMKVNDVRGPIKSSSGFHIIKLIEKKVGQEKLHKEIHARQILLTPNEKLSNDAARTKLLQLRAKLLKGADFMKMARENSTELSSRSRGGDLGWVSKSNVMPEFFDTINKLKTKQISQPFKTKMGWHLVQVLEKRNSNNSLEAAKNRAKAILHDKKFNEKLDLWLKNLKANAKIENFLGK